MTSSKGYWWTRKSFETVLTAAVFVWLGALVVDVIRTAHTPVRGQLFVSVLTAGVVATDFYVGQRRKRETSTKPQAKMPTWAPPVQTWYMGGLLLLLAYLQVVTYGYSAGASWASTWLSFTAPFSDLVARVVPPIDAYSESLAAHGYQNRVPIVRHAQAVSWVWLALVNIYMIIWVIRRWSYTKQHVKSQSFAKKYFRHINRICSILFMFFYIDGKSRHI
jgi:phosphate starvation-inducible membrane PsiE